LAEPLKNHFGSEIPITIAGMLKGVEPAFTRRLPAGVGLAGGLGESATYKEGLNGYSMVVETAIFASYTAYSFFKDLAMP